MKKASWYSVITIVVLMMAVAAFVYVAPHIGWRVNAVLSGSMEPALKVGSLVVTRPVEPDKVEVGDMITFNPVSVGENMITHRVIGIAMNSPIHFATKGDANDKPDPFMVPEQNLRNLMLNEEVKQKLEQVTSADEVYELLNDAENE